MICKSVRASFTLILLWMMTGASLVYANTLEGLRVWPAPDETRVVIDLKQEADYSYFTLSSPSRLVVDLKNTDLKAKLPINVTGSAVLSKVRKSTPPTKGTYRLVFELKKASKPNLFKLSPTPGGQYGHRLVVDLPHSKSTAAVVAKPTPASVSKQASQLAGTADIIVAIDAGHGGEDPGSIGPTRKYEKHTTLAVSKKVAAKINAIPGMKAVLTRRGDYFVNLNRRSDIARKNKAHLLVSIHADSFTSSQPRGGSVFVLNTKRANTEIARWVEKHEEQSELLGGAGDVLSSTKNDRNLSQTLLDLQFSHSQKEGFNVATNILAEMGKVTKLHRRDPIHASLAVLKSPDIPSVLVETGFISNPKEEKLLFQKSHQDKLARAITKAVVSYFEATPPEGTLFALRKNGIKHKVKKGESLSLIAKKYNSSVAAIQKANKLKGTGLAIGQVLSVPSKGIVAVASGTSSSAKPSTITHVVKSGEYLGKIAQKYNVTMSSIRKLNNLRSDTLKIGQKLKVSTNYKATITHKVKRGDFLGKIAANYGVTIDSIRKTNKLRSDTLAVGQTLIIPSS